LSHGLYLLYDDYQQTPNQSLAVAGIKLNEDKCGFSKVCVKFLGHIIDEDCIRADPEKIATVQSQKYINSPEWIKDAREKHESAG